jgi:hypothetical protein
MLSGRVPEVEELASTFPAASPRPDGGRFTPGNRPDLRDLVVGLGATE